MDAHNTFKAEAPVGMGILIKRFHLLDFQAAGVMGNFGRESGGFTNLRESKTPGVGGYGFGQWTGPRHRMFLNWCAKHGLEWHTPEANWGYLAHELSGEDRRNNYAYVVAHLHESKTLEEATRAFMHYYERPGIPALSSRLHWAQMALAAYRAHIAEV